VYPEREAELKRLAEADAHILDAEQALAEQTAQVQALQLAGQDIATAQRELIAFEETLAVLRDHRETIVQEIERIDAGRP
jgi:hypothetical protein